MVGLIFAIRGGGLRQFKQVMPGKRSSDSEKAEQKAMTEAEFYQQNPHLVQPLPSATPAVSVSEKDLFGQGELAQELFGNEPGQRFVVTAVKGQTIVAQAEEFKGAGGGDGAGTGQAAGGMEAEQAAGVTDDGAGGQGGSGNTEGGLLGRSTEKKFELGQNARAYLVRRGAESRDKLLLPMAPANALVTGLKEGAVVRVEAGGQEGVKDKIYYLEL